MCSWKELHLVSVSAQECFETHFHGVHLLQQAHTDGTWAKKQLAAAPFMMQMERHMQTFQPARVLLPLQESVKEDAVARHNSRV